MGRTKINKIIITAIVLTIIAAVALAFTACHKHTYSNEWSSDETSHWHESLCGHDNADQALHEFDDWQTVGPATDVGDVLQQRECKECGYTESKTTHVHSYAEEWSYDATSHWHDAICGHSETSGNAAHDFISVGEEPSTCQVAGVAAHKICNICKKLFDANNQPCETDDLILPLKGHRLVLIPGDSPDCTNGGLTDGYYCVDCEQTIVEQQRVRGLHKFKEAYYSVDIVYEDRAEFEHFDNVHATCQAWGYASIECEVCQQKLVIMIIGPHEYEDGSNVCKNCGQIKRLENTYVSSEVPDSAGTVIALPSKRKQTFLQVDFM